jgi:mono/diheme cytochrome c family protein
VAAFLTASLCVAAARVDGQDSKDDPPAQNAPKSKAKSRGKGKPANRQEQPGKAAVAGTDAADKLRFSRDIAPILVANCTGCHNGQRKDTAFNLTSYQRLMAGGKEGPVIAPGKPDQSKLVQLVREREMPRGQNRLSDQAIETIAKWVAQGALLDAGAAPTASLDSIAPSPETLEREKLARLKPEERDSQVRETGLDRWKKSGSKSDPEITPSRAFMLFHELPKKRADSLLRALEAQRSLVGQILGPGAEKSLGGPEKISVYVFNDRNAYVEFARGLENREVEKDGLAHARLDVQQPYLAAVDPLGGGEEPTSTARKSSRTKKTSENELSADAAVSDRALAAVLVEQLAAGATARAGKAPRWLSLGLGAYVSAQLEPRGSFVRQLRSTTLEQLRIGWRTKTGEALGEGVDPVITRAVGFALCDFVAARSPGEFAAFVRTVCEQGGTQLYEIIKQGWGFEPDAFLELWANWVGTAYRTRGR